MNLKIQAYKNKWDFDRMSIKNDIIRGHHKLTKGYSTTICGHTEDITISIMNNGNRIVANRGHLIYKFGPTKN